jgi:transcriptional regulator with XRE-family HTH domain
MQQPATVVNSSPQNAALIHLRAVNATGRTARELGKEIGMDYSTITRWIKGEREPTGKGLRRLLEWAAKEAAKPFPLAAEQPISAEEAIELAHRQTAHNLVRLSQIQGYARSVLDMMQAITEQQRAVVDGLSPWLDVEAIVESERIRSELNQTSTKEEQAKFKAETTPPAPAKPRRKAKDR